MDGIKLVDDLNINLLCVEMVKESFLVVTLKPLSIKAFAMVLIISVFVDPLPLSYP